MSRRRAAIKREVLPDAKFGDVVLTKLINTMMYDGKEIRVRGDLPTARWTSSRKKPARSR